jgi:hypothetical protein
VRCAAPESPRERSASRCACAAEDAVDVAAVHLAEIWRSTLGRRAGVRCRHVRARAQARGLAPQVARSARERVARVAGTECQSCISGLERFVDDNVTLHSASSGAGRSGPGTSVGAAVVAAAVIASDIGIIVTTASIIGPRQRDGARGEQEDSERHADDRPAGFGQSDSLGRSRHAAGIRMPPVMVLHVGFRVLVTSSWGHDLIAFVRPVSKVVDSITYEVRKIDRGTRGPCGPTACDVVRRAPDPSSALVSCIPPILLGEDDGSGAGLVEPQPVDARTQADLQYMRGPGLTRSSGSERVGRALTPIGNRRHNAGPVSCSHMRIARSGGTFVRAGRVLSRACCYAVLAAACSFSVPAPDAGTDGGIPCPGTQCPCPCEPPLVCGPHWACTRACSTPEDCGAISGETCLAGLCGVVCRPGGPDDCGAVGMAGAQCLGIHGVSVCGYPPEVTVLPTKPEAADGTGSEGQ